MSIQMNDVAFGYKKSALLFQGLDFQSTQGSITGLFGLNGSGKTTMMKLAAGLLFPKKGECLLFNKKAARRLPEVYSRCFFLPESFDLPDIRPDEYVKIHAPFYRAFDHDLFRNSCERFGVPTDKKLGSQSFGMKKKFLISFAIAVKAQIYFMDEPTNGLDIPSKSTFRKLIAESLTEEQEMIISTHQVRDLGAMIDRVSILKNGKVIFDRNLKDICDKAGFGKIDEEHRDKIIFSEKGLNGEYGVYAKNDRSPSSEPDLEMLFSAAIENDKQLNNLFNK